MDACLLASFLSVIRMNYLLRASTGLNGLVRFCSFFFLILFFFYPFIFHHVMKAFNQYLAVGFSSFIKFSRIIENLTHFFESKKYLLYPFFRTLDHRTPHCAQACFSKLLPTEDSSKIPGNLPFKAYRTHENCSYFRNSNEMRRIFLETAICSLLIP